MPKKYLLLIAVALAVMGLDQGTKYLVLVELTTAFDGPAASAPGPVVGADGYHYSPKRSVTVVDGLLRLRYAENPGAAWGLFRTLSPGLRASLFHVVSVGAVVLISLYFSRLSLSDKKERWAVWGLPLILGGALGNYADRLTRGFVVDFVEAHWHDRIAWPSFNVADSAISIGVVLLVLDAIVRRETKERA